MAGEADTGAGVTLAVMQPYFLPYIGYWQLLACVDKFIVLDDVAFITRGWIHRNRLLSGGGPTLFTLPVRGASQNRLICEIERADTEVWQRKFRQTLRQNYCRAPHFEATMELLEPILANPERNLSRFVQASMRRIADHLAIATPCLVASAEGTHALRGQERILDICRCEGASRYVNLPGGRLLYDGNRFAQEGIELRFIKPEPVPYPQRTKNFEPWLSIVDILMNTGRQGAQAMLGRFSLE